MASSEKERRWGVLRSTRETAIRRLASTRKNVARSLPWTDRFEVKEKLDSKKSVPMRTRNRNPPTFVAGQKSSEEGRNGSR